MVKTQLWRAFSGMVGQWAGCWLILGYYSLSVAKGPVNRLSASFDLMKVQIFLKMIPHNRIKEPLSHQFLILCYNI